MREDELKAYIESMINVASQARIEHKRKPRVQKEGMNQSKKRLCIIPLERVKNIVKSTQNVASINQNATVIISAATELFIQDFTREIVKNHTKTNTKILNYDTITKTIRNSPKYAFLGHIVPEKVLFKDYIKRKAADY
ncbi:MAG: Chromatin accessibility complex protein 1 [Marteilia pararefringens]